MKYYLFWFTEGEDGDNLAAILDVDREDFEWKADALTRLAVLQEIHGKSLKYTLVEGVIVEQS